MTFKYDNGKLKDHKGFKFDWRRQQEKNALSNPDTVPAMLTPGEFVMNPQAVQAVGMPHLMAENALAGPQHFAMGGMVGTPDYYKQLTFGPPQSGGLGPTPQAAPVVPTVPNQQPVQTGYAGPQPKPTQQQPVQTGYAGPGKTGTGYAGPAFPSAPAMPKMPAVPTAWHQPSQQSAYSGYQPWKPPQHFATGGPVIDPRYKPDQDPYAANSPTSVNWDSQLGGQVAAGALPAGYANYTQGFNPTTQQWDFNPNTGEKYAAGASQTAGSTFYNPASQTTPVVNTGYTNPTSTADPNYYKYNSLAGFGKDYKAPGSSAPPASGSGAPPPTRGSGTGGGSAPPPDPWARYRPSAVAGSGAIDPATGKPAQFFDDPTVKNTGPARNGGPGQSISQDVASPTNPTRGPGGPGGVSPTTPPPTAPPPTTTPPPATTTPPANTHPNQITQVPSTIAQGAWSPYDPNTWSQDPWYQWQYQQGSQQMKDYLGSLGRENSTYGMNTMSDFTRGLNAAQSRELYNRWFGEDQAQYQRQLALTQLGYGAASQAGNMALNQGNLYGQYFNQAGQLQAQGVQTLANALTQYGLDYATALNVANGEYGSTIMQMLLNQGYAGAQNAWNLGNPTAGLNYMGGYNNAGTFNTAGNALNQILQLAMKGSGQSLPTTGRGSGPFPGSTQPSGTGILNSDPDYEAKLNYFKQFYMGSDANGNPIMAPGYDPANWNMV